MKTTPWKLCVLTYVLWGTVALAEAESLPLMPKPGVEASDDGFPGEPGTPNTAPADSGPAASSAAPAVDPELARLTKTAETMLDEKSFLELIDFCQEAIFASPDTAVAVNALHYSALAHRALGELETAQDLWGQALVAPAIDSELRFRVILNLAQVSMELGDAIGAYERIGSLTPSDIDAQSQADQKRYLLLSAQAARKLGQPEVAAEIYATQFVRLKRQADQEELLRELEEALIEIQERESIAELLSKVTDPRVRTRISMFVELIPRLRLPPGPAEELRWKKLAAPYRFSLESGLNLYAYQQAGVGLTLPSSVVGASTRMQTESGIVGTLGGRLSFASFWGDDTPDAPRLLHLKASMGKVWRLSSTNAVEARVGGQYLTLISRQTLLLKHVIGPRLGVDFRRWIEVQDWMEFGLSLGLFGDGNSVISASSREWTFHFSIYRQFSGAIRRLGLGLEFASLNLEDFGRLASSQGLQFLFHVHF